VVAEYLDTFLAGIDADPTAKGLPSYVKDEFQAYLQCGILAHGFLRLGCDTYPHQMLLAFKRPCKDARALQEARVLSLVCREAHGRNRSAPLALAGRGCSSGSFPSIWNAAPDVTWVPGGSSPRSPTDPSFAAS
jgi:hypothetical protein